MKNCPNCAQPESKKTVCRCCGYEYREETEEAREGESNIISTIFTSIIALFVAVLILFTIDRIVFDARAYNAAVYKSDCDYKVPAGYKIVYNGDRFAVKKESDFSPEFLRTSNFSIESSIFSFDKPATFQDSCAAKGYLKAYFEQQKENFK
jgi:hypothetical protein